MSDIELIKSHLSAHPDFPKKVCLCHIFDSRSDDMTLGHRLPRHLPYTEESSCIRDSDHPFGAPYHLAHAEKLGKQED